MMLYIFYITETDGEINIKSFTSGIELQKFVNEKKLSQYDYSIINGELIKSFNSKIDWNKLNNSK